MPVLRARVIVGDIQVNMTCHIQRSHAKNRLTQKLDENMSNVEFSKGIAFDMPKQVNLTRG